MASEFSGLRYSSWLRLGVSVIAGVAAGLASSLWLRTTAPMLGYIAAAGVYIVWTWVQIGSMNGTDTKSHASREDAGRLARHVLLILAVLASLVGVWLLLSGSGSKNQRGDLIALVGIGAVAASWFLVQTLYTTLYARLYFTDQVTQSRPPIDFNGDDDPCYADFAYLGFTLGMTYQVSDTNIASSSIRRAALRHGLLSYLLGAVVLACTINLIIQLVSG